MKQNISFYDDYRQIITDQMKRQGLTFKKISEKTGIHNTYISRVMKNGADFSSDQLLLISKPLGFKDWEVDYFLNLGLLQSSSLPIHKIYFKKKLNKIKYEHQKIETLLKEDLSHLTLKEMETYYESPLTMEVHIYLTLEKFKMKPELLTKEIPISTRDLEIELSTLEELGIIARTKEKIDLRKSTLHLDESHPTRNKIIRDRRIDCLSHLSKRSKNPDDYHFSVMFSTSEEKKEEIKLLFKEFIKEAKKVTYLPLGKQRNVSVFKMNFDLY